MLALAANDPFPCPKKLIDGNSLPAPPTSSKYYQVIKLKTDVTQCYNMQISASSKFIDISTSSIVNGTTVTIPYEARASVNSTWTVKQNS